MTDILKTIFQDYGGWARTALIFLAIIFLSFVATQLEDKFMTREEITSLKSEASIQRNADLESLDRRISKLEKKTSDNQEFLHTIDTKISRIEAQNEFIIRAISNLTEYRNQDLNK